jgi:HSP20 family protein
MLMRFDPFRELDRLAQARSDGGATTPWMPIDAYRRGDAFIVHFDLPGVQADSINLTVEKNVLTVNAERRWDRSGIEEVVVAERPQGMFSRQLFLGDTLDPERIEAHYENGVLTLTIPIAEQAKPRRVEVQTGGHREAIDATST